MVIAGDLTTRYRLKNRVYLYKKLIRTHDTTAVFLTFWPSLWSLMLAIRDASVSIPQFTYYVFLMMAFSFLLLCISNIYNDLIDRDFDRKVERCKDRPIASGAVSTREAIGLLCPFLLLYILLLIQMNGIGKVVMVGTLGLVMVYAFAKRFTNYPAVVLGLTANNGIFLGWVVVRGDLDWSVCFPLLLGAFFWTIVYDTIYGLQDKADDARIGVRSMALSFGSRAKLLTVAASILAVVCFVMTGVVVGITWPYYVALTAVLVHLLEQVLTVNVDDAKDCGAKYRSNRTLALIMFVGITASNRYHHEP